MNQIATQNGQASLLANVMIQGNLKDLTDEQRVQYYSNVCDSLGLNPATRPFEYITLNGKLVLYARKDCTEQLRKRDRVSITIVAREVVNGVYVVTSKASTPDGRTDESIGAVTVEGLKSEALANAYMKAETKSKRRVTLSICGLGMLDETEVETIPSDPPKASEVTRAAIAPPKPQLAEGEISAERGDSWEPPADDIRPSAKEVLQAVHEATGKPWADLLPRVADIIGRPLKADTRALDLQAEERAAVIQRCLEIKAEKDQRAAKRAAKKAGATS